jgi:hypothetical protein
MHKVTLAFPTHDSLWLFNEQSKAINVAVTPMKKIITGLFSSEEVTLAEMQFLAIKLNTDSNSSNNLLSKPRFAGKR